LSSFREGINFVVFHIVAPLVLSCWDRILLCFFCAKLNRANQSFQETKTMNSSTAFNKKSNEGADNGILSTAGTS